MELAADHCDIVADFEALLARGMKFKTIYADPPWRYDQSPRGAAEHHYPTMSLSEIKAMPIAELCSNDSHLHLWATHSLYAEALEVLTAWGFSYRSLFVWVKPQLGMGHYWRSSAEFLLFGTRGDAPFRDRCVPNWLCAPRSRHSEKPQVIRRLVELVSPGPYLELFGRQPIPGWTVYGNQFPYTEPNLFDGLVA